MSKDAKDKRAARLAQVNAQKAEGKRIRALIHDYCLHEQRDKGCTTCPVNAARVCEGWGNSTAPPLKKLREAERIILHERGVAE